VRDQGLPAATGVADYLRVLGRCGRDANEFLAVARGGIRAAHLSHAVPVQIEPKRTAQARSAQRTFTSSDASGSRSRISRPVGGSPHADHRAAEHASGHLQRDGIDVVVGEVVVPGPLEPVQRTLDVGEERVAAQPGEQPDTAGQNGPGGAVKANTSVRSRRRSSPGNLRLSALKWLDMMTPEGVSCG